MPYIKNVYDNLGIPDMQRTALEKIEEALRVGYHAIVVGCCAHELHILGDVAAFWPFVDGEGMMAQDFGPNGYHLYTVTGLGCNIDLEDWDTPPYDKGALRVYQFNGTDEYLGALDQDAFTVEAGHAFSIGAWVNMVDSTASCILSKWDETDSAEKREWKFGMGTTGYPGLAIYDETNNAMIGREDQTTLSEREWHFVAARYDGGTDAANIDVFVDGVETDDADIADDVGFASMVNQTTRVRCGSFEDDGGDEADLFDGAMWGPFFVLRELSDDEMWLMYQLGKAYLDLDLIGGQPK